MDFLSEQLDARCGWETVLRFGTDRWTESEVLDLLDERGLDTD